MIDPLRPTHLLSKSRFIHGLQCPKNLWWRVHEPDAPELTPDPRAQGIFDRGHRVGELARTYVPGGVLIDLPHYAARERVEATQAALAAGAPAVYEASFVADEVFVAVDILERTERGYALVEVKSTLDVKEQHIPDAAIQVHVARGAGIEVERAEVMHLNRACRFPDLTNLFVRENVNPFLDEKLREIPGQVQQMKEMLVGPSPEVSIGPHCTDPYPCPFISRCWPPLPENHVSTLYGIRRKKAAELDAAGIHTVLELPRELPTNAIQTRQIESVRRNEVVVEPGLRDALAQLTMPIAFLDFETISPAIPVWPGCAPAQAVPVQFSCHTLGPDGLTHREWLADGAGDPREALARALIAACAGANAVAMYTRFEDRCVAGLARALPHLAAELEDVTRRLRDMRPVVRDHVYHPAFQGSFSIKAVLPALVPGQWYDTLAIQDGDTASRLIEQMLLASATLSDEQRLTLRRDLLRYCEMDTLAMVRLYEVLRAYASVEQP